MPLHGYIEHQLGKPHGGGSSGHPLVNRQQLSSIMSELAGDLPGRQRVYHTILVSSFKFTVTVGPVDRFRSHDLRPSRGVMSWTRLLHSPGPWGMPVAARSRQLWGISSATVLA
jgi:hypothetical protein